ncbi:glyoxalase [uncultured Psychroserpens sp.]|uniref:glyoxalase n=1 Tax=uncultured Psychroserpens sp. TaxID=255436 RepID=UPI002630F0CD|nr:glyoxalase [uncultured Psychroserpens sp.]
MEIIGKSIRPFIGSKNYNISRNFYLDLGFNEIVTSKNMSYFYIQEFGFYLQDAYVKDWIDNSMIFYEVENLESSLKLIKSLKLTEKYDNVRLSEIVYNEWGNEFFLHDPSGILWHIGKFKTRKY